MSWGGAQCAPPVAFSYQAWTQRYPEFSAVPQGLAQAYFNEATLYCRNDSRAARLVGGAMQLGLLLNMLTSHIAALNSPVTAAGSNPATPPGRLSDATEGSVSASFQNDYPPGTPQWFQQTKYGAAYWQASSAARLSHGVISPTFSPGPASRGGAPWIYPNVP